MIHPKDAERPTKPDFAAKRAKSAARRAKRAEKVQASDELSAALDSGAGRALAEAVGLRLRKVKKKAPARKTAFLRLKDLCRQFVLLRAKHRTGGFCEVAMQCQGRGPIEVPYHVTPQAMGNALKYDERNLLGSCRSCNGSEYFARKRGASIYRDRHAAILGTVFPELEAAAGRRQISTVEAIEMGDRFKAMIERGEWRK